jgi:hypothetical protein
MLRYYLPDSQHEPKENKEQRNETVTTPTTEHGHVTKQTLKLEGCITSTQPSTSDSKQSSICSPQNNNNNNNTNNDNNKDNKLLETDENVTLPKTKNYTDLYKTNPSNEIPIRSNESEKANMNMNEKNEIDDNNNNDDHTYLTEVKTPKLDAGFYFAYFQNPIDSDGYPWPSNLEFTPRIISFYLFFFICFVFDL